MARVFYWLDVNSVTQPILQCKESVDVKSSKSGSVFKKKDLTEDGLFAVFDYDDLMKILRFSKS